MKNSNWKIRIIGALIITVMMAVFTPPVHAETDRDDIEVINCMRKSFTTRYWEDWGEFLDSSAIGFFEDFIHPWGDVILSNQCQSYDLLGLTEYRDDIEQVLMQAFLTCDLSDLEAKQATYWRVSAEIYYVRNVIDRNIVASLPFVTITNYVGQPGFTEPKTLRKDMEKKFGGRFTEEEFNNLYAELEAKYAQRKYSYIACEHTAWREVVDKWEEFREFFEEDFAGTKELAQNVKGRWKRVNDTGKALKDLWTPPSLMTLNAYTNLETETIDWDDLAEDITSVIPIETISRLTTQGDLVNKLSSTESTIDLTNVQSELEAQFKIKYMLSDSSIDYFMTELDLMDQAIKDSFTPLNNVKNCSKDVTD